MLKSKKLAILVFSTSGHTVQWIRRTPLGYAEEEKEHLDKLLDAKVIDPSESEWASPSVLVRKKDGSVR